MAIVVTGDAGFIGANPIEEVLKSSTATLESVMHATRKQMYAERKNY